MYIYIYITLRVGCTHPTGTHARPSASKMQSVQRAEMAALSSQLARVPVSPFRYPASGFEHQFSSDSLLQVLRLNLISVACSRL